MSTKKSIIYYNIGKNLLEEGKIREALEALEVAIFEEPGFVKAKEAYDSALAELEETRELAPRLRERILESVTEEGPRLHYYLGKLSYFEGDYLGALDELVLALEQAQEDIPLTVEIQNLMGSIYYIRDEHDLLLEYAELSLALDNGSAGACFNKALWFKTRDLLEDAKEWFHRTIQLNRRLFHAYDELGEIYILEGELAEAEGLFQKILEIIPDWLNSYLALGEISLRKGDSAQSLRHFKRALEIMPDDEKLLSKLGKVHNMAGDPRNAINCLEQLLKAGTARDEDIMNLGVSYLLLMVPGTARKFFTKVQELQPYYPLVHEMLILTDMLEDLLGRLSELPNSIREHIQMGPELLLGHRGESNKQKLYLPLSNQTTLFDFRYGLVKGGTNGELEARIPGEEELLTPPESPTAFMETLLSSPRVRLGFIFSLLRTKNALSALSGRKTREKLSPAASPGKDQDSVVVDFLLERWKPWQKDWKERGRLPGTGTLKELIVLSKDDPRLDFFLSFEALQSYRNDGRKKWVDLTMKDLQKGVPLGRFYLIALFPEFLGEP